MTQKTDGNGDVIAFTYDGIGRKTLIDYPAGETDVSFSYALDGQALIMTDSLGTINWSYDSLGRVASVTNPDGSKVEYTYDALGNRLTMTTHINASDVVGKTITYAYDELGRLTRLSDWDGQQTQYGYDAVGRLAEVHFPNEVVGMYTYNSAGRLTGLVYQRQETILATYAYTYDAAGNQVHASETVIWAVEGQAGTTPPSQLTAEEQGYLAVTLAWPDGAIEEDGYTLERSTDGQNWIAVAELSANTLRYTDYGLARHTRYGYHLTPYNGQGDGPAQTVETETKMQPVTYQTEAAQHTVTIGYTYDARQRLTAASYSDGAAHALLAGWQPDAGGHGQRADHLIVLAVFRQVRRS